jgi:cytosine/adenosine deaminase-related metal-dependent hydrolase
MSRKIIQHVRLLESDGRLSPAVSILIEGDSIASISPGSDANADVHEASGLIAIPGLINAHTHAHNNLTRGIVDSWSLEEFRLYGTALFANRTADDQYLSAALGAIEMLKTGCTAAYEQFVAVPAQTQEGIDAVMQAYSDVGIRAVIAPAFADISMFEAIPGLLESLPSDLEQHVRAVQTAPTTEMVRLTKQAIRQWQSKGNGRLSVATAPVIAGECSDELLRSFTALANEHACGVHTHLAETKTQAVSSLTRFGQSLVDRLDRLKVLGPNVVAAHAIWVTPAEIAKLADHGVKVAHNPASNLKIGSGIAPVRELMDAGVTVGLGTDGSMASDNQNMFEAMRFAALVSKVRFAYEPERWLSAKQVLAMATVNGSSLLGMPGKIGVLEIGAKADIVLLRAKSNFLRPAIDIINQLVYAETAADVADVFVGGELVVSDGQILTVNEQTIYERAQQAVDRLLAQNKDRLELARRIHPFVRSACAACARQPFPVNRYAN